MTRKSNDRGRAFEYSIAKSLEEEIRFKNIALEAPEDLRGKLYFKILDQKTKESFKKASEAFSRWIDKQGWLKSAKKVIIRRFTDREGVKGNVTDIQLVIQSNEGMHMRNISLKHHHNALKHPRLPRLPEQCGIYDKKIREMWKETHDKVWKEFYAGARKIDKSTTKFSRLKKKEKDFINKCLYKPLITKVIKFLKQYVNNPKNAASFFKFLTGDAFYTIKNEPDRILIKKFIGIKLPSSFKIEYPYNGFLTTFLITFNNGWKVTLRLHTASSEFFRMWYPEIISGYF